MDNKTYIITILCRIDGKNVKKSSLNGNPFNHKYQALFNCFVNLKVACDFGLFDSIQWQKSKLQFLLHISSFENSSYGSLPQGDMELLPPPNLHHFPVRLVG